MNQSAEKNSTETMSIPLQTFTLVGITVLLTQLPLLIHLPLLLTIPGMLLALIRLTPSLSKKIHFSPTIMTPLTLLSAVAVILYYGNFFARDPCVVFLFLLIDFKFIETKRTNDASLILVLCAFLLLTQFFFWQTIIAAVLAIPSMFMIGLALFSLQRGPNRMPLQDMTHVTARLFLQAMPIAAILFIAVPRLPTTGYGSGSETSAVTGLSSSMVPGSVSGLTKSTAVAFRVNFEGTPPSILERYWRGPVLSSFDGTKWSIDQTANQYYELPESLTAQPQNRKQFKYTVTMEPTINPWLPALDTPISLPISGKKEGRKNVIGNINHERQINATRHHTGAYRYSMTSYITDRFTPSMQPADNMLYIAETNPATRNFARELRERYTKDEQLINQILMWFNQEPFHYTLQPQKLGENGVDEFLFSSRRGFCEHYAGSFVFMLRAAGIPARVVTGYQGGEMNGDYMIVRQSDAHAWAEAFVNGQWKRYDPTAAVALERVESGLTAALGNEMQGFQQQLYQLILFKSAMLYWDAINYKWQNWIIDFDSGKQNSIWNLLGLQKPKGWHIALLLVAASAAWTFIIVIPGSIFSRHKLDPCEKQWSRFQRKFSAVGYSQGDYETPTSYIHRLSQRWPAYANPLEDLLQCYHRGRFSEAAVDTGAKRQCARRMKVIASQLGNVRH